MAKRCLIAVGLTTAAALAAWAAWPDAPAAHTPDYDLTATAPEEIRPGTVVEPNDHPGWSHLVLKSQPRLRPDQRDKVNDLTARMAGWMVTAMTADVKKAETPAGPQYQLRAVGLGLGTAIKGKDTVITPETADRFGADLGFITRSILSKGYEVQRRSRVVVRGPTFWLVDTPLWFAEGGKHRLDRYRHALMVDGGTGQLDVLVWRVDTHGRVGGRPPATVWLNPEAVDRPQLVVDENEFTLGIPSEAVFAVDRLPGAGAAVTLSEDLLPLAARSKYTTAEAATLEAGLRRLTGSK